MRRMLCGVALGAVVMLFQPAGAIPVGENACAFAGNGQADPVEVCQFTTDDGPHFFFTQLDSLRAYIDVDGNGVFNANRDIDVLADYSGDNHRVDPGPTFERTEDSAGTYEVEAGRVITVEALTNGGNYLGGYFIR